MNAVLLLTVVHVAISLAGIAAGFVVLWGLLNRERLERSTLFFLATTIATSVSGFLFPATRVTPAHVLGVISLAVLAVAVYARYQRQLTGNWRVAYVVSAVMAQYLNFFVLVVQSFQKVPGLKALAPTQTEPVFAITQLVVLAAFVALGVAATVRFRSERFATALQLQRTAA